MSDVHKVEADGSVHSVGVPPPAAAALGQVTQEVALRLARFIDAAAGEGLVLAGVDAADLFYDLYDPGWRDITLAGSSPAFDVDAFLQQPDAKGLP
jgi:hypothetical protein